MVKTESLEDVWRDYYTGKRLVNFTTMPFDQYVNLTSENCAAAGLVVYAPESSSSKYSGYFKWLEVNCDLSPVSCVCQYPAQPIMYLRGGCPETYLDRKYIALQESVLDDVMWVGIYNTRIEYDLYNYQWRMEISDWGVTAHSWAEHRSYILGKHNWTISNDYGCNGGNNYTTELKATGCNLFGDFTCDSGQCVSMERRCDQVSNCWDKSDERGCKLLFLEKGYNKNIPPISVSGTTNEPTLVPALTSISTTLMNVVKIEEVDHSIHLQFEISIQWRENRARYQNLKRDTSLNVLNDEDIGQLWLPLLIYANTDQKESTRLGWINEWSTSVTVTREGNFERNGFHEVDEAEIFKGADNRLTMNQTYTKEFQCPYQLQRYPFDTQAI